MTGASRAARAAPAEVCPGAGAPARVAAVLDGLELALEDGRVLRLAGIDAARGTASRPGLGEEARARLAGWLVGRDILVHPLVAAPDRWGRISSLVFASGPPVEGTAPAAAAWSVAEALLDAGWARAAPDADVHACFSSFLRFEAKARTAGLGLWSDPYYAVVDADDRRGLAQRTGSMVIVEGRIGLRSGPRRTVVTLGRGAWGLIAKLPARSTRTPGDGGLDLRRLAGAEVRLRGFLDDRFGLRIDLGSGDGIETLGPASADPLPTPAVSEPRPAATERAD